MIDQRQKRGRVSVRREMMVQRRMRPRKGRRWKPVLKVQCDEGKGRSCVSEERMEETNLGEE